MIILQPEHQLSMNSTVFLQLLTSNSTSSTINYLILNPNSKILMNNNKTTCYIQFQNYTT